MNLERLLRLDPSRRIVVMSFKDMDRVVGFNSDGSYIIEPGDEITTYGWPPTYARYRRRLMRLWLRLRRWRRDLHKL